MTIRHPSCTRAQRIIAFPTLSRQVGVMRSLYFIIFNLSSKYEQTYEFCLQMQCQHSITNGTLILQAYLMYRK